jgi:integrase/recombinase XerD
MPNFSGAETDERLVELWLARKAPSTGRKYAEDLAKFSDFTGGKSLASVTLSDLHDFASFISVLMAPSSQGRVLATIKSLLSFANKVGYLPFNVGAAIELPRVKDTLSERILTEAEVHRIMNAPKSARDRALVSALYAGALRREEAVRLKWRDLKDRDDLGPGLGQATLFGKGSRTGVALLPASVYSQILALRKVAGGGENAARYAGEDEPVFRSRKRKNGREGHLEVSQVNRIISKAARDAGIERPVSPHWLRHAHASHAHARKTDLALIRDTLRHSSIATTGRYLHARPNDSSALHLGL